MAHRSAGVVNRLAWSLLPCCPCKSPLLHAYLSGMCNTLSKCPDGDMTPAAAEGSAHCWRIGHARCGTAERHCTAWELCILTIPQPQLWAPRAQVHCSRRLHLCKSCCCCRLHQAYDPGDCISVSQDSLLEKVEGDGARGNRLKNWMRHTLNPFTEQGAPKSQLDLPHAFVATDKKL